jgi:hypothetical protein
MIFLKSIDDKLKDIGFTKMYDSNLVVQYERTNTQFKYIHGVDLVRKTGRCPIIQSFQKDNSKMVGLTILEAKLFLKKIKKLKW